MRNETGERPVGDKGDTTLQPESYGGRRRPGVGYSRMTVLHVFLITAHSENVRNCRPSPIRWVCLYRTPGTHEPQVENSWSTQGYRRVGQRESCREVERWREGQKAKEVRKGKEVRAECGAGCFHPPPPHVPRLTLG